jgi:hypothetical protein
VLAKVDRVIPIPGPLSQCHVRVCLPKQSEYNDYMFQYHGPTPSTARFEAMAVELGEAAIASQVAAHNAGQGLVHREPARFSATVIDAGIITDLRKFVALHLLQSCELLRDLLASAARPHVPVEAAEATWNRLPTPFGNAMTRSLNGGQLAALQFAMATKGGITLLQGPPGTGKTKTVVALLNSLCIARYTAYHQGLHDACIAGLPGGTDAAIRRAPHAKPRILVCAPSNAGVDEILTRIAQPGVFIDGNCAPYNPDILRIASDQAQNQRGTAGSSSARDECTLQFKVEAMLSKTEVQLKEELVMMKGNQKKVAVVIKDWRDAVRIHGRPIDDAVRRNLVECAEHKNVVNFRRYAFALVLRCFIHVTLWTPSLTHIRLRCVSVVSRARSTIFQRQVCPRSLSH